MSYRKELETNLKPGEEYVVCMVRKSDGKFYFSNANYNLQPIVYTYTEAVQEAERRAKNLSDAYKYVVTKITMEVVIEKDEPPVKRTFLTK